MASLGHLEFFVQDPAGNAVAGAAVEIRRQGAQCSGAQTSTTLNVDAVNGVVVGDSIVLNTAASARTVTGITATTITYSGVPFNVVDDDRLSISAAKPTIYEDPVGNTSTANPLTTNALGYAHCYIVGGLYDVLISGGGIATTLYVDRPTEGAESVISNAYNGAGAARAYNFDTLRALDATDTLIRVANAGNSRFALFAGGGATFGGAGTLTSGGPLQVNSGPSTFAAGGLNVSGTLAVTGAVTATTTVAATTALTAGTTVTAGTGVTATTGNIQATAGDADVRRLLGNNGTALVAGDFVLSAGWGNTASLAFGGVGSSFDTRGVILVTCNGAGIGANPTVTLTYKDGAFPMQVFPVVCRGDNAAPAGGYWAANGSLTTQFQIMFVGLPVAGSTYITSWVLVG
jgi:hypothetical protein